MDVVWIASYPKSGNTWVRFLFTHVLHGPFEHSQTIFEVTPVLERGIDPSRLHTTRPNLIKTHHRLAPDLPMLSNTAGAIYIVRDPLDVMMSNLNYYLLNNGQIGSMGSEEISTLASRYMEAYIHNGGDPRWRKINYGSWREHVESWTANDLGIPVKLIRYEDLLSDTLNVVRDAAAFAGVGLTEERLAVAIELSSFENMRAMEEREIREQRNGMFYTPASKDGNERGLRFMNRGTKGVAREMLGPDVIEQARKVFAPHIDRFGYVS